MREAGGFFVAVNRDCLRTVLAALPAGDALRIACCSKGSLAALDTAQPLSQLRECAQEEAEQREAVAEAEREAAEEARMNAAVAEFIERNLRNREPGVSYQSVAIAHRVSQWDLREAVYDALDSDSGYSLP